jgi:signal transduction histidine kinase
LLVVSAFFDTAMRISPGYPRLARCLLASLAVNILLPMAAAGAPDGAKQVLVLYSLRRDVPAADVGEAQLPRILRNNVPGGVDYYSEFLDRSKFHADYAPALRGFLQLKYEGQTFDLVIAIGEATVTFIEKNRDVLFPDVPVVFFSSRPLSRPAHSTGAIVEPDLSDTLLMATELQPETRHVYVVSGAESTEPSFETMARAQFKSFEPRLDFTYLTGLTKKELEPRLTTLPDNSIVYYLSVERDRTGQNFHALEFLDWVTAVARAPVYSWIDSAMDHGIVGGSLRDQVSEMQAVGELAVRVLQGEAPERIPVVSPDLHVRQVDWRELRRWGINGARASGDLQVKFREPSAWDRYGLHIVGALLLLIVQMALITGLLVQGARRQEAERQLRDKQEELVASYDRIRDLGGRLLNAQDDERSRIARDLHDDIGQQVAVLAVDLELLRANTRDAAEGLAGDALTRVQGIARSVRDLSLRLHPAKLRLIGLVPALNGLQREYSQSGTSVRITHENLPAALPNDLTLCLFRIVQEGLQNAVKHGQAGEVYVHLSGSATRIALTIVDDGTGFDVAAAWGRGLGLISMRERLDSLGGTLAISSSPGVGTRIDVDVALHATAAAKTVAM